MTGQRGGIVTGWLVKLVIGLLAVGLVAFEIGAVVIAKVNVDGTADTAAREAAFIYGTSRNVDIARAEAEKKAAQAGAKVTAFSVSQDGQFVTVTVEKIAKTIVIHKIGVFKNLRVARSTHTIKVS